MNRVALITGAAQGIGMAAVERLADDGFDVALFDLPGSDLTQAIRAAGERGRRALEIRGDVASEADWIRGVAMVLDHFGRLDALINNAGISGPVGPFSDYAVEDFDRVHAVNTRGVFLGMKHCQAMLRLSGGAIVNIASISGLSGGRNTLGYTASKHAVVGMTKQVANELAAEGVRVNAVCPAPTATEMMRALAVQRRPDDPDGYETEFAKFIPMQRYGAPREIADAIAFLAGPQASFITGIALPVDGGACAR